MHSKHRCWSPFPSCSSVLLPAGGNWCSLNCHSVGSRGSSKSSGGRFWIGLTVRVWSRPCYFSTFKEQVSERNRPMCPMHRKEHFCNKQETCTGRRGKNKELLLFMFAPIIRSLSYSLFPIIKLQLSLHFFTPSVISDVSLSWNGALYWRSYYPE